MRDLQEQLEEAESMEDISRAEDLREELEFISQELSRAFGLGGRQRPQGSAAERTTTLPSEDSPATRDPLKQGDHVRCNPGWCRDPDTL